MLAFCSCTAISATQSLLCPAWGVRRPEQKRSLLCSPVGIQYITSISVLALFAGFALLHLLESHGVHIPLGIKLVLSLPLGSGSNQANNNRKRMKSNSQSKRVVCNPFPRSLIQVSGGHGVDVYEGLCAERAKGGRGSNPPLRTKFSPFAGPC